MGGIGKTALAVEAGHRVRAKGWFGGGTLFVDLRGYDDDPVTADQAVLALLDALGVRDKDLPPTTERQYDAYRTLLAERDRMLLILDNASDPSQYLPLLPGTVHHRVLITSRDRPDALPVRLIDLETLDTDDSLALVSRALRDTDERDDRPVREFDALRELTHLCGHLPLALQIAAAMLRRRRRRSIASLVGEIKEAGDPTSVLDNGSRGTDLYGRSLVLRPVLETSYRRLPSDQARLLRLLALAPGAETGTEAVATLADLDEETVLSLLEDLAATHLVTTVREGKGATSAVRWRLHDLVRAYGVGVAAGDAGLRAEGEAARERLLSFYCRWADAADDRLRWLPGKAEPERFRDRRQALSWLDVERPGLVAAVSWAEEQRYADAAVQLAWHLREYLRWRGYFDDWITATEVVRKAVHRSGDRLSEAIAWHNLGLALLESGHAERAVDAETRALDTFQFTEDHREALAWNGLGHALRKTGRVDEATDAHTRARDLSRASGNLHREALAWDGLGRALREAGRVEEAAHAHAHARDLYQATGDRYREGTAWHNFGIALRKAGRAEEAIEAHGRAVELFREFDDRYGEGRTLCNLALAHQAAHHHGEIRTAYLQAADAYTRASAPTKAAQARARAAELA
ncbi:tetratricopeptide repeat protein [Streptomyces sp. NPDC001833]|uniref:tetratricopeptide repeat protein n=1 Tax=Streptomyces sp. NPDC001833 TaxID=3154658 RepID=UPI003332694F